MGAAGNAMPCCLHHVGDVAHAAAAAATKRFTAVRVSGTAARCRCFGARMPAVRADAGAGWWSASCCLRIMQRLRVDRISMAHPGDVSEVAALVASRGLVPSRIRAVIGKTEGNGGLNDFTRGYFIQTLMHLLATHTGEAPDALAARIPCVLSGGTEGVLSPHAVILSVDAADVPATARGLAIATAFGPRLAGAGLGPCRAYRRCRGDSAARHGGWRHRRSRPGLRQDAGGQPVGHGDSARGGGAGRGGGLGRMYRRRAPRPRPC